MSKYSVTISNDDGTVEKVFLNNYKEISDKTGLSVNTITRMMNGVTKYHKKDTKTKLSKFNIKKLEKSTQDGIKVENNELKENIIEKASNKSNPKLLMNILKYNVIDTTKNIDIYTKQFNSNLYSLFNADPCTSYSEKKVLITNEEQKNNLITSLITEIGKNISDDTLYVIICNKDSK